MKMSSCRLKTVGIGAALLMGSISVEAEPTYKNVEYGAHEHNVLDFWQADSKTPTPFVLFIHGGGFAGGDKSQLKPEARQELLNAGISVVSVNYRYYQQAALPAALHDCRRALQFVRSKAEGWNLDRMQAGAFGPSAGAVTCMYLAFHDEMADPSSSDPVARESTRLAAVAITDGQTTLDTQWWIDHVPGWSKTDGVSGERHASGRWGCSEKDYPALIAEGSALNLISKDDPPIWMHYQMKPNDSVPAKNANGWKVHHVAFGVALKEKMDELGVEAILSYPGERSTYTGPAHFLRTKLK